MYRSLLRSYQIFQKNNKMNLYKVGCGATFSLTLIGHYIHATEPSPSPFLQIGLYTYFSILWPITVPLSITESTSMLIYK